MRAIRTIIKRGDDLPMTGKVMRVHKGLYEVVIKFTKSRRIYHVEQVRASNVKAVKLFFAREYPTLMFGKPRKPRKAKPVNPDQTSAVVYGKRLKRNAIAKDLRTPKYKPRVVASKKTYKRKPRTNTTD